MSQIILLLIKYRYFILFPLSIIEGPILTVIGGFLVTMGYLNPFIVYPIVVIGDIIGDSIFYALGRWSGGPFIKRFGPRIKMTPEKIEQVRNYFQKNHKKALVFSKLVHGIGSAGLLVAGGLKIPWRRFVVTCGTVTIIQSVILLFLGILFGHAYNQIAVYLNYYAAAGTLVALIIATYIVLSKIRINLE